VIIGHQKIIDFLSKGIKAERLAHAYLFVGPSQVGKKTTALEFVKALLCQNPAGVFKPCAKCRNCVLINQGQHPDVMFIVPGSQNSKMEGKDAGEPVKNQEIKISQIRELQHQLSLTPFSAPRKVVIIDSAEKMTQEASNCLLKTFEEPPPKSLLILISSNFERLLPTIISRCQMIKFLPVGRKVTEDGLRKAGTKNQPKIMQVVRLASGRPGVAISLIKTPALFAEYEKSVVDFKDLLRKDLVEKFKYAQKLSQNAPDAQEILDQWLVWLRDQMLVGAGAKTLLVLNDSGASYPLASIFRSIKNVQETQRLLGESSFNARLVLENLMIKL